MLEQMKPPLLAVATPQIIGIIRAAQSLKHEYLQSTLNRVQLVFQESTRNKLSTLCYKPAPAIGSRAV